jgi:hypothetical protein
MNRRSFFGILAGLVVCARARPVSRTGIMGFISHGEVQWWERWSADGTRAIIPEPAEVRATRRERQIRRIYEATWATCPRG